MTHSRARDSLALLALAALALVFFWPVSLNLGWIPRGGGDLVSFLWPTYAYGAEALRAGRLPLWSPALYSGAPFLADNQSGVLYPPNALLALVTPGVPYRAVEWLVVGHVWLAGAAAYACLRQVLPAGTSRAPALAGAVAYMFSDVFVTHVGNLNIIAAAAWLPASLGALHRGLARRRAGWSAAAGALWALGALAGHAQMMLASAIALALFGAWWLGVRLRDWLAARRAGGAAGAAPLVTDLAHLALAGGVGVGLSAGALLPAFELARYTARAQLGYPAAAEYSLPWAGLAGLFSPLLFGRGAAAFWAPWPRVELGYAGVGTLLLATLAVGAYFRRPPAAPGQDRPARAHSRPVQAAEPDPIATESPPGGFAPVVRRFQPPSLAGFWFLLGLFGLVVALGENTPVHRWLVAAVPGFGQLRVPARFILLTDLALAGLAAEGLGFWEARRRPAHRPARSWRRSLAPATGLWGVGCLVMLAGFWAAGGPGSHWPGLGGALAAFSALIWLTVALLAARGPWAALAVVSLLALDLVGHGAWVEVERNDPTTGYQHPAVVDYLKSQPGPFRIDNASGAWAPDAAAMFGLEDIGGISNPLALAAYQTYLGAVGSRGSPLYNFLNAQFVIADKGQPPGDSTFVPVFAEDPALDVYLNTQAQPGVRLVYAAEAVGSGEEAFAAIHRPGFDPERAVVLHTVPGAALPPELDPPGPPAGAANLFFVDDAPEHFTVIATNPAAAYLVFSEVWYPGWRAWVDGQPVPVHRANFAFRAVYLPEPGEHTVTLRFEPTTVCLGLSLTGLTALCLVAAVALQLLRRRRSG